jgi:hypothetical protein
VSPPTSALSGMDTRPGPTTSTRADRSSAVPTLVVSRTRRSRSSGNTASRRFSRRSAAPSVSRAPSTPAETSSATQDARATESSPVGHLARGAVEARNTPRPRHAGRRAERRQRDQRAGDGGRIEPDQERRLPRIPLVQRCDDGSRHARRNAQCGLCHQRAWDDRRRRADRGCGPSGSRGPNAAR